MKTSHNTTVQSFSLLQNIISKGGPETMEYDMLNHAFDHIAGEYRSGKMSSQQMALLLNGFGDEFLENTLHGHVKIKPYGYAGDFMIIDKIYREQITDDDRFVKWDIFWNNQTAFKAVRNRKDYFLKVMRQYIAENKVLRLLNVASGPARDLFELFETTDSSSVSAVCVEADKKAINYAATLTKEYADHIQFINKNIFRFSATQKFDIVWSAGLFDYFEDDLFVKLLSKFMTWTNPGGEVIIGNFSEENPSRNYMELVGDWFLHHRSEKTLTELALRAGAKKENIKVGKELLGVNLFLHVKV